MAVRKASKSRGKGPGRLSAEDAAGLTDRLLDAAEAEFAARGYEGARIERIAKAAAASTKTIYARYANKTELLQGVVHRMVDRTIASVPAPSGGAPSEPRAFLTALLTRIGIQITDHASMSRFALSESYRHPDLARFYAGVVNQGIDRLRVGLEAWAKAGVLTLPADSLTAATLLFSGATDRVRILAVLGVPMSKAEIGTYVSTAVTVFLRACSYPAR